MDGRKSCSPACIPLVALGDGVRKIVKGGTGRVRAACCDCVGLLSRPLKAHCPVLCSPISSHTFSAHTKPFGNIS